MTTPPNTPDPSDPKSHDTDAAGNPRSPGTDQPAPQQPRYGQYAPGNQPGTGAQGNQPYTPYGQPGSREQNGQQGQQSQPPQNQYGQPGQYGQPNQYGQPPLNQYGQQPQSPYGYQAPQPSGYAYGGTGQPGRGAAGPPPREVMIGYWLILGAGILALINNVLTFLTSVDVMVEQVNAAVPPGTEFDPETIRSLYVVLGLVMSAIGFLLYVLVAVFVRRGKNWARILGTVFAALSVLGMLLTLPSYFTSVLGMLSGLSTIAGAVGIVMLYLRPAQPFFRSTPAFGPYKY